MRFEDLEIFFLSRFQKTPGKQTGPQEKATDIVADFPWDIPTNMSIHSDQSEPVWRHQKRMSNNASCAGPERSLVWLTDEWAQHSSNDDGEPHAGLGPVCSFSFTDRSVRRRKNTTAFLRGNFWCARTRAPLFSHVPSVISAPCRWSWPCVLVGPACHWRRSQGLVIKPVFSVFTHLPSSRWNW
jgi:hypothetical protein